MVSNSKIQRNQLIGSYGRAGITSTVTVAALVGGSPRTPIAPAYSTERVIQA